MKQYGPADLTKKVAVLDDLENMVVCVEELPDSSIVTENTVMKLISPQRGYCASHLYRMREGKWVDVTFGYGPSDNDFAGTGFSGELDSTLTCSITDNVITLQRAGDRSGFLRIAEKKAGKLKCCLVMRKVGSAPVNCNDGEFVAILSPDPLGDDFRDGQEVTTFREASSQYKYAAFEIFGTDWSIKSNCVTV